ncbi:BQ2448_6301 [Microbotryum intermedium]|uniref:BQ2448_6301 protein n=1 Tax=Microbotryum intermedium TaxID=269621 RepID=A0A238FNW4_9BASI|nr:BQ2448_6301 [Microbotryum intermedium]
MSPNPTPGDSSSTHSHVSDGDRMDPNPLPKRIKLSYDELANIDGRTLSRDEALSVLQSRDSQADAAARLESKKSDDLEWRLGLSERSAFINELRTAFTEFTKGLNYSSTENLQARFPSIAREQIADSLAVLDSVTAFRENEFLELLPNMWQALFPTVLKWRNILIERQQQAEEEDVKKD